MEATLQGLEADARRLEAEVRTYNAKLREDMDRAQERNLEAIGQRLSDKLHDAIRRVESALVLIEGDRNNDAAGRRDRQKAIQVRQKLGDILVEFGNP